MRLYLWLRMQPAFLIASSCPIARYGMYHWMISYFPESTVKIAVDFMMLNRQLVDHKVNLIIFALELSDTNDYQTISRIRQLHPGIAILVFSRRPEAVYARRYLKAGANVYVNKQASEQEFMAAVRVSFTCDKFVRPNHQESILGKLSNNELGVGKMLVEGFSLTEIAKRLKCSTSSVSTFKLRLFQKLKIKRLPQLLEIFKENQLAV